MPEKKLILKECEKLASNILNDAIQYYWMNSESPRLSCHLSGVIVSEKSKNWKREYTLQSRKICMSIHSKGRLVNSLDKGFESDEDFSILSSLMNAILDKIYNCIVLDLNNQVRFPTRFDWEMVGRAAVYEYSRQHDLFGFEMFSVLSELRYEGHECEGKMIYCKPKGISGSIIHFKRPIRLEKANQKRRLGMTSTCWSMLRILRSLALEDWKIRQGLLLSSAVSPSGGLFTMARPCLSASAGITSL